MPGVTHATFIESMKRKTFGGRRSSTDRRKRSQSEDSSASTDSFSSASSATSSSDEYAAGLVSKVAIHAVRTCTLHSATVTGSKHKNNEDRFVASFDIAASTNRCGQDSAAIFAVFDGHGGDFCSQYLQENFLYHVQNSKRGKWFAALEDGIAESERKFCRQARRIRDDSGACLIALVITPANEYVCAGVGDCRCILGVGWTKSIRIQALSRDHTANAEQARIRRAGGYVRNGRVSGVLEPARTIGDLDVKDEKNSGVNAIPEMKHGHVVPGELHVFVLASDGLWDVFSNADVINFVHSKIANSKGLPCKTRAESQNVSSLLVEEAVARGSRDDITVLVNIVW
jgi:serine/threonine protein phosphatase PrpC